MSKDTKKPDETKVEKQARQAREKAQMIAAGRASGYKGSDEEIWKARTQDIKNLHKVPQDLQHLQPANIKKEEAAKPEKEKRGFFKDIGRDIKNTFVGLAALPAHFATNPRDMAGKAAIVGLSAILGVGSAIAGFYAFKQSYRETQGETAWRIVTSLAKAGVAAAIAAAPGGGPAIVGMLVVKNIGEQVEQKAKANGMTTGQALLDKYKRAGNNIRYINDQDKRKAKNQELAVSPPDTFVAGAWTPKGLAEQNAKLTEKAQTREQQKEQLSHGQKSLQQTAARVIEQTATAMTNAVTQLPETLVDPKTKTKAIGAIKSAQESMLGTLERPGNRVPQPDELIKQMMQLIKTSVHIAIEKTPTLVQNNIHDALQKAEKTLVSQQATQAPGQQPQLAQQQEQSGPPQVRSPQTPQQLAQQTAHKTLGAVQQALEAIQQESMPKGIRNVIQEVQRALETVQQIVQPQRQQEQHNNVGIGNPPQGPVQQPVVRPPAQQGQDVRVDNLQPAPPPGLGGGQQPPGQQQELQQQRGDNTQIPQASSGWKQASPSTQQGQVDNPPQHLSGQRAQPERSVVVQRPEIIQVDSAKVQPDPSQPVIPPPPPPLPKEQGSNNGKVAQENIAKASPKVPLPDLKEVTSKATSMRGNFENQGTALNSSTGSSPSSTPRNLTQKPLDQSQKR